MLLIERISLYYLMNYELIQLRELRLKQGRQHEDEYYNIIQEMRRRGMQV